MSFAEKYAIKNLGVLEYKGIWNANTNTPSLNEFSSGKGDYYIVGVAGTTNLNGITDWQPGDWLIFSGSEWQKIDNSELVTSVAGRIGNVELTKNDVGLANVPNIDATSRNNHTGTQLSSTISDFNEATQDAIGLSLNNSNNIIFNYPDELNSISADLTNTTVIPGTYDIVAVDAKGRITSGINKKYQYILTIPTAVTGITPTSVSQLTTEILPIGIYQFKLIGQMQSSSATAGVGIRCVNGTSTITTIYASWRIKQNADGLNANFEYDQLSTAVNVVSASVITANTNFVVTGEGLFRVTVAGTVTIQIRSELAGSVATIQPDSILVVETV